jgi:hypothetical protein
LSKYRYEEAPMLFALDGKRQMDLDAVKRLVQWKLRHGKFRPMLMKLVSSNDAEGVKQTVQEALATYRKDKDASAAVNVLIKLKGIGPATASLLLAVHAPDDVTFFSDEAFYWLCCDGKIAPIKYNAKEYRELDVEASKLAKRLSVRAVDVEKVAFVIMRQDDDGTTKDRSNQLIENGTKKQSEVEKKLGKRKVAANQAKDVSPPPTRPRPKRQKK